MGATRPGAALTPPGAALPPLRPLLVPFLPVPWALVAHLEPIR